MLEQRTSFHGLTDVGIVRDHNEDAFGFFGAEGSSLGDAGASTSGGDVIAVLSDGVGGHDAGELASSATVAAVGALLGQLACLVDPSDVEAFRERVEPAMAGQNRNLRLLAKHRGQGKKQMAATLTSVWLAAGRINLVHAGDSRLYRLRDGKLEQLSIDDTIAGRKVAAGEVSEKEGRSDPKWHVIQKAMGIEERKFGVTVQSWQVADGDTYLLCSDGLTDGLTNAQLEKGFAHFDADDPAAFCERLINAGNQASGKDNITVALLTVGTGWCAASRRSENRTFFKQEVMKQNIGILNASLLALFAVAVVVLGLGLRQSSLATDTALTELAERQIKQKAATDANSERIKSGLSEHSEELLKLDIKFVEERQQLKASVQNEFEAQSAKMTKSRADLVAALQALQVQTQGAQEQTASVAGQLVGLWASLNEQREQFAALKESVTTPIQVVPEVVVEVVEPLVPEVPELSEVSDLLVPEVAEPAEVDQAEALQVIEVE